MAQSVQKWERNMSSSGVETDEGMMKKLIFYPLSHEIKYKHYQSEDRAKKLLKF